MSILLNAKLLLFSVTLPQADTIVTRHASDLKMGIGYKQASAKFVYALYSKFCQCHHVLHILFHHPFVTLNKIIIG